MRTLSLGSVVLGCAVVLMSWDVSRRFVPALSVSGVAPVPIGPRPAPSLEPSAKIPAIDAALPAPKASRIAAEASRGESSAASRVAAPEGSRAVAEAPRRIHAAPALPVRQFTPGSKAHIGAIVTAIDSEESESTIAPVARLYFAFFDRAADYEGLNYYIDERNGGASLESIAEEFAGSSEFSQRYGTLDNAAFIDRMFRVVFDVPPDSTQRAYWIDQLESGTTRGQVMVAFSESATFRAATSNEVFVTMAYAEALRREPDPAGFARWVRFLEAGNPREAVIAGLLGGGRTKR